MRGFMVMLLECSAVMSVLTLLYMLLNRLLLKRYAEKWRYYSWLIIIIGLIIPFRPSFGNAAIKVDVPERLAMSVIEYENRVHFNPYADFMSNPDGITISSELDGDSVNTSNSAGYIEPYGETVDTPDKNFTLNEIILNVLSSISWLDIAAIVWLIGMTAVIIFHIIKHKRFVKMTKRWSDNVADKQTLELFQNLKTEMKINRHIDLQLCPFAASPMLVGFIKPRIFLPETDYERNELWFILKHELVHYKRKDVLYRFLLLIATAMHWFNPVVHILAKSVDIGCEVSCDDEVVKGADLETRKYYSNTILRVLRYQTKLKTLLSTHLNGDKRTMKRRLSSIMDIGRKRGGVIIAVTIVVAVLGTGLVLAINTNNPIDENLKQNIETQTDESSDAVGAASLKYLEQLPETNKLVLYRTFFNQILFDAALKIFNRLYPDVEVEVVDFANDYDETEYIERLKTEIPAGNGPDLLFMSESSGFTDIYKVMDTEVFCDLNDFIRSDADFNLDDYNKVVLDSGMYKGKRYIMPLDYQTNILITTNEAMVQAGMNIENLQSFDGFTGNIKKYLEMNASTKLVYNSTRRSYTMLFPWCGLKLIDYENKKVNVDGNDFKKVMETYKDIYKQDWESEPQYINDTDLDAVVKGLISGKYLFYKPYAMNFFTYNYSALLAVDQSPIYVPVLSTEGKKVGSVYNSAAILKSSPNKANAYAFLKILLSEDIQDADPVEIPISYNPVLNNALEKRIKSYGKYHTTYEGKAASVSEEILQEYGNMQADVYECQLYTGIPEALLKEIFTNYMLPYFKNEDSYENCLNKTRNFLESYLSE